MLLSKMAQSIGESATLKLNAEARRLREMGEPVIHLGGGEPKSKAPFDALMTAAGLLNTGEVRYTPASGVKAIRQAVADYTYEHYGYEVGIDQVMVSGGGKQAIMCCLHAVVDPGSEVIFPSPYWVSYPDMTRIAGGVPVVVDPPEGSLYPRAEDIRKAVTDKTKAIIINRPNNPSGLMYSEEFMQGVVEIIAEREIVLIMDDIYRRLLFDGRRPVNTFQYVTSDKVRDRLVVVNGVSKQYAMTGFRIGWAVGNPELINAMGNIQAHETSGPSSLSQYAAIGALQGDQTCVKSLCSTLESNRDILMTELKKLPKVKVIKPEGTFYCFPDFSAYEPDSMKLADYLLKKAMVVTVPGVPFGRDGHLRISYCGMRRDIIEGIARIKEALESYDGNAS
jgi:aspartate aminotransferase